MYTYRYTCICAMGGIVVIWKWFDWSSDTTVGIGLTSVTSTSQIGLDFAPILSTNRRIWVIRSHIVC